MPYSYFRYPDEGTFYTNYSAPSYAYTLYYDLESLGAYLLSCPLKDGGWFIPPVYFLLNKDK